MENVKMPEGGSISKFREEGYRHPKNIQKFYWTLKEKKRRCLKQIIHHIIHKKIEISKY